MTAAAHVFGWNEGSPSGVCRSVAATWLDEIPRRRDLVIVAVVDGPTAGLRPAPWTMDALLAEADARGFGSDRVALVTVAPSLASAPALRRGSQGGGLLEALQARVSRVGSGWVGPTRGAAGAGELVWHRREVSRHGLRATRPTGDRVVSYRACTAGVRVRVPAAWVGANLCIVAPLVHRVHGSGPGGEAQWIGPATTAISTLGALCLDGGRPLGSPDDSARVLAEVFATVSFVLDASFWTALHPEEAVGTELMGVERWAFCGAFAGPHQASALDRFLAESLGLPTRAAHPGRGVTAIPSRLATGWPRVPVARVLGDLARRERIRSAGPVERVRALPPVVPGRLGPLWTAHLERPVGEP